MLFEMMRTQAAAVIDGWMDGWMYKAPCPERLS